MQIDINELAPWVAIAITLILSILVPVFSQMANNRFHLKLQRQKVKSEEIQMIQEKKNKAFESFVSDVGAALTFGDMKQMQEAGASIGRLYLYLPSEHHKKLDDLFDHINGERFSKAKTVYLELAKIAAEEQMKLNQEVSSKK